MGAKEIYYERVRNLIWEVRAGMEQLPEGPERDEMARLLKEMERILEERIMCL